ncbi:MAG: 3-dehydroquinate dehydratase [Mameliella sp.]|nr:3-dehydroquinate dehydratase [Mameliella sp.]
MPRIMILNGPNLDIMGRRKNAAYNGISLADVDTMVQDWAKEHQVEVDFRQSNHEGVLVDWIHEALDGVDGLIINATALTHTSLMITDALAALECPTIELHFSNVHRDPTRADRHVSVVRRAVTGVIAGFGPRGYLAALDLLNDMAAEAAQKET